MAACGRTTSSDAFACLSATSDNRRSPMSLSPGGLPLRRAPSRHVRSESPRSDPLCGLAGCREDSSTLTFRLPLGLRRRGTRLSRARRSTRTALETDVFEQSRQHRPLGPLLKRCEPTQRFAVFLMRGNPEQLVLDQSQPQRPIRPDLERGPAVFLMRSRRFNRGPVAAETHENAVFAP